MSLNSLLSIARTALSAHQTAIGVTAHNIANAGTDGYTRQEALLEAKTSLRTPFGSIGRGVTVEDITRQRNRFLDARFRQETGVLNQHTTLQQHVGRLEAILGEPSDTGLSATLDAFWNAWSDLANDPTSGAARSVVRATGQRVADTFNAFDDRFAEVTLTASEQLTGDLNIVNSLAREIADLNEQIVLTESGGHSANDLRDRRDAAIDRIGDLLPVRVVEAGNGSVTVLAGDALIVDQGFANEITVQQDPRGRTALALGGIDRTFIPRTGRVAGHLDGLNQHVPDLRRQLDRLAGAVVTAVNSLHETGITATGASGRAFFDPNGVTGSGIQLSLAVRGSVDEIATGTSGAPGDGSLAADIGRLSTTGVAALNGRTIHESFTSIVASVGEQVRQTEQLVLAQETTVGNLQAQRASEHGVSIDEEMVALISHQQAYAAAARVVTVADTMVQEILQMV